MRESWRTENLESVAIVEFGTRVTRKNNAGTKYPVYGGGGATFLIDEFNRESCFIVSRFAMSEECVRKVSGKFFLNDSGLSVRTRDAKTLNQNFLDRCLLASSATIYEMGRGAAQKNLDSDAFKKLAIPLPPIEEQERIVAKLDEALAYVDELERGVRAALTQIDSLWKLYLGIHLGFIPDPDSNTDNSAFQKVQLGELCELRMGKTPSRAKKEYWDESKLSGNVWLSIADLPLEPLVEIDDSKEYLSDLGASLFAPVSPGTLLMSFKLSIGRVAIASRTLRTNEAIMAFTNLDEALVDRNYLGIYLSGFNWDSHTEGEEKLLGSTMNKAKLKNFEITLPSVSEQQRIVAKLDVLKTEVDELKQNKRQVLAELASLRSSILRAAFAGEL